MINVTGCQIQDGGARRIWFFNDNSQVVEYPALPQRIRFQFFDAHNRRIRNTGLQGEMKKAIEQYRKIRGIK